MTEHTPGEPSGMPPPESKPDGAARARLGMLSADGRDPLVAGPASRVGSRARWSAPALAAAGLLVAGGILPRWDTWRDQRQPVPSATVTVSEQGIANPRATDNPGLAISLRRGPESALTIAASRSVSDILGNACIHEALEPLLVREAQAGGEPDYLARLATETLETAEAAGRRDTATPDPFLVSGLAVALLLVAFLIRWLARDHQTTEFVVPNGLARKRSLLELRLAETDTGIGEARTRRTDTLTILTRMERGIWDRIPVLAAVRRRRRAARAVVARTTSDTAISALQDTRGKLAGRLDDIERLISARQEGFVWRASMWRETRECLVNAARPASVAALLLAGTYAVLAQTGHLPSPGFGVVTFPNEGLLAMAVDNSAEFTGRFRSRCGFAYVSVPRGNPMQPVVGGTMSSEPDLPIEAAAVAGIAAARPLLGRNPVRACSIGIPCGGTCIPTGRVCHVGQPVRPAQACGHSYIAANEVCHLAATGQGTGIESRQLQSGGSSAPAPYRPESASGARQQTDIDSPSRRAAPLPITAPNVRGSADVGRSVDVKGYTRSDGITVNPYVRSAPASRSRGH